MNVALRLAVSTEIFSGVLSHALVRCLKDYNRTDLRSASESGTQRKKSWLLYGSDFCQQESVSFLAKAQRDSSEHGPVR
ncbi:hypothetical protein Rmet_6728 (plasmid) [Cupriavidus metallidurans CH34]|uniref:Uncharacterized protein n=1 Tax=Cupriavidus metallidurans (strain ATCC 43123 / DSM 2839 / NBRC 102507 / CH34) TaxID=266264 RepID=D3DYD7_CUPMC|nr:hypothetical protein Rmet_6728 [Cupriavidus metallidurans CH34]